MSASILIVNLAVLLVVLESDLGTRKVSAFRIARPLLMALGIVLLFIEHPATAGPVRPSNWLSPASGPSSGSSRRYGSCRSATT